MYKTLFILILVIVVSLVIGDNKETFAPVSKCPIDCKCNANWAGYDTRIQETTQGSCLYGENECYKPPQEWADPPPLDYRVKTPNVCLTC